MNMPYAHCKGILMGTLTMELGGKVTVECEKTGYKTELEFKLRVSEAATSVYFAIFVVSFYKITAAQKFFVIYDFFSAFLEWV